MKKILLASTMLAAFATVADAETGVKISGYGRFGLVYDGDNSFLHTRLRFNIDATTETDAGVTFGGRIRLQNTGGGYDSYTDGNTSISPALLYVEYEGLRVEVGNVNTAFDSAALIYDSEIGLTDSSFGDSQTSFYSFSTGSYHSGRAGVYASYSMSGFTAQASYIDDEHYHTGVASDAETSIALSYSTDQFTVSAAAVQNGAGIADNDAWFIGGAYNISDVATVGLNYIDEGTDALGQTIVLYGSYKMDAVTLKGYVGQSDAYDSTVIGIGADYDLGGAKLTGSIQDNGNDTVADVGVRFNF
ncbi:porin [Fuscibacter oryzae]|uniref:Porin n=1 Tax=Fuscibacter oryzae TaxID=2803939 RepID=A0A8J7MXH5_9RHOB|nr:porin [Fuscibacter oryzae]MBL4929644.1 porin [Fuscibacter oryzae]